MQVGKPADVMHCTWPLHTAAFTRLRQEPLHDFTATSVDLLWVIGEGALPVSAEGDAAKPGDQRCMACSAFVVHLQYRQWAMRRGDRGPTFAQDCIDARPMFVRQRLGQRELHHPVDLPQPMDIKGHQGVLHQAPVFRLVLRHDAVIRRMETRGHVGGFPVPHVLRARRADDLDRHLEPEGAVDAAPMMGTALLVICLLGDDLLAEQAGGGRACMGDQGFLF